MRVANDNRLGMYITIAKINDNNLIQLLLLSYCVDLAVVHNFVG